MNITLTNMQGIRPRVAPHLLEVSQSQTAENTKLWSGDLRPFNSNQYVADTPVLDPKTLHKYRRADGTEQWLCFESIVDIVPSPISEVSQGREYISGIDEYFRTYDSETVSTSDYTIDSSNSYWVQIERPSVVATMTPKPRDEDLEEEEDSGTESVAEVSETPAAATPSNDYGIATMSTYVDINEALSTITVTSYYSEFGLDPEDLIEESRSYIYCYARYQSDGKLDEGGLGVPAQTVDGSLAVDLYYNQNCIITGIKPPVHKLESKITHIHLYRSAVGSDGTTSYRFVEAWSLDDPSTLPSHIAYDYDTDSYTYEDSTKGVDLGEQASNSDWDTPVEGLTGVISLNNGILVGFKGKRCYFSVPSQAHAWPYGQSVLVDYDIVGLGAFGDTVVICTTSNPVLCTVQDPELLILQPIAEHAPCLSKQSIASLNGQVLYASANGIISISTTQPTLISYDTVDRDTWDVYNPKTMHGHFYRDRYFLFFTGDKNGALVMDLFNRGGGTVELSTYASSVYVDPTEDEMYMAYRYEQTARTAIYMFDRSPYYVQPYTWRSKVFTSDSGFNTVSAARVNLDRTISEPEAPPVFTILPTGFNQVMVNTYAINGDNSDWYRAIPDSQDICRFNYYIDGELWFSKLVYNSKPFRIKAGKSGHYFEIELISTARVRRIQVANSMAELR